MAKALGALTLIAAMAAGILHFLRPAPPHRSPAEPADAMAQAEAQPRTPALPAGRQRTSAPAESGEEAPPPRDPPAVDFDWRATLRDEKLPPQLPREAVEAFLEKRQRSAESLLAAYHALNDSNLLVEAASRFPNDPRVLRSVLSSDLFPEERRKWLDLFKATSPDNALANYLSAQQLMQNNWDEASGKYLFGASKLPLQEFLKTGAAQAAINELAEATAKPLFKNYGLEARLDEEELNLAAGRSVVQAHLGASGWAADLMPELAKFKSIAISLQQMEKSYLSAGDTAGAQNLAQMGLALANRLRSGENGNLIINQLVGMASEAIHLNTWDANTSYDFLGGKTPRERLAELKQERGAIRTLDESVQGQLPNMAEEALLSYLGRERIYGELEAMRWLRQRTQTAGSGIPGP